MLFINAECGNVPALYFMSKRERPSSLIVAAIFAATVPGEPTHNAPSGPASLSKFARTAGGQPRSAPMRVIITW